MNKISRINALVEQLNNYRHEYYNLSKPSVEDLVYDKLFDELAELEKETGYILSASPTQTVGFEVVSKLNKVEHSIPLLSLDKTKSVDDLLKFIGKRESIAMLKGDGLTVKLDYENGKFIRGSTRGSGIVGEDITINVKQFKNIPLSIPFKGKLTLTGEALIHYHDFDLINSKLPEDEKYKNPRNLTSGSVRQLDSKECSKRNVYFYAFNLLECDTELSDSKYERFKWLEEQGFWTILNTKITNDNVEQLEEIINSFKIKARDLNIPIDGLVFSFDSVKYSESLGATSHHPLHSIAFKFEDEISETILRDIEWSVGKNYITPVAIFDSCDIDGTSVSRASLHNISIMQELQLGLGDSIGVIKANMIIPQVVENFTRSNNIKIPHECPVCKGKTEIRQDNDSKVLICTNADCDGKFIKKLSHFVSRDAMNIEGLSEATLEKFIDEEIICWFEEIFQIEKYKSKIVKMDGFGLRSYNKLIEAINKSKETEMYRVIYAMSIPLIGKSASKAIAKHFEYDMNKFIEALDNKYDFTKLEDFGKTTNDSLNDWWNNYKNDLLSILKHLNVKKPEKKSINIDIDSPFVGKKIYATGTFANYKKDEIKNLIESLGAEFASGYAKSLDYLIVGSVKGSSKEDKARKDGVTVLQEDEFIKMIG